MPRVIVVADAQDGDSQATMEEHVVPVQAEDPHFATQLAERVRWAVQDAAELEHEPISS